MFEEKRMIWLPPTVKVEHGDPTESQGVKDEITPLMPVVEAGPTNGMFMESVNGETRVEAGLVV